MMVGARADKESETRETQLIVLETTPPRKFASRVGMISSAAPPGMLTRLADATTHLTTVLRNCHAHRRDPHPSLAANLVAAPLAVKKAAAKH